MSEDALKKSTIFTPPEGETHCHAYHSPIEHKVKEVLSPFQNYIHSQICASLVLLLATLTAVVWASYPKFCSTYQIFTHISIGFHIADYSFSRPLYFWVNDILLTVFFFFVGLEIKREFLVGELTNPKKSILITCAAVGGMLVPASLYFLINYNTPTQSAWGIPMATDAAFALGILSFFRKRMSKGIFTFLAALAIIDDIGSIIIIAVFYTTEIKLNLLSGALGLSVILLLINFAGFRRPFPYIFTGILIWALLESAGIHGTVSGILVAFLIPARPKKGPRYALDKARKLLNFIEKRKEETPLVLKDEKQHIALAKVQSVAIDATTPLQRWESQLRLPIAIFILPLFALVNAGIPVNTQLLSNMFLEPASIGILIGLIIGKPLGVYLFSWFAVKCRLGILPEETSFKQIFSIALLTGIGFTMSIFIANLNFGEHAMLANTATGAILFGSLCAGLLGIIALRLNHPNQ